MDYVTETNLYEYIRKNKTAKLYFGTGNTYVDGFFSAAPDSKSEKINKMSISDMKNIGKETFDYILAEYIHETETDYDCILFTECARVLKKGGVLRVVGHNLEYYLSLIENADFAKEYIQWYLYKYENKLLSDLADFNYNSKATIVLQSMYQRFGRLYNEELLHDVLVRYGFEWLGKQRFRKSRYMALDGMDTCDKGVPEKYKIFDTLVIEVSK